MLCGIFTTLLIPETKRKTLEELAGEVPGTPMYDPTLAGAGSAPKGSGDISEEGAMGEKSAV